MSFRLEDQQPPPPRPVADGLVERYGGILEIDSAFMQEYVRQQDLLDWDHRRIAQARWDYLAWMERHTADKVLSGAELLADSRRSGAR